MTGVRCFLMTSLDLVWSVAFKGVLIWRKGDTRNKSTLVREVHSTRGELVISVGLYQKWMYRLQIMRKCNTTAQSYAEEILRPHVVPYAAAVDDFFSFNA
ncbi:hypothetical protein TNCV_5077251 [Trichonephila clavipes]|uniref:Uncharacterized protein n=1 Tax=Trichonephila clavipes TaxID=2585209 RepID=A0A8X6RY05_TRICX|nr:hypothetical protein TNCV_5077251 [Trichonephila clavipes]